MVCSAPLASWCEPPQCRCIWTAVYIPGRPWLIVMVGGRLIWTKATQGFDHWPWILYLWCCYLPHDWVWNWPKFNTIQTMLELFLLSAVLLQIRDFSCLVKYFILGVNYARHVTVFHLLSRSYPCGRCWSWEISPAEHRNCWAPVVTCLGCAWHCAAGCQLETASSPRTQDTRLPSAADPTLPLYKIRKTLFILGDTLWKVCLYMPLFDDD